MGTYKDQMESKEEITFGDDWRGIKADRQCSVIGDEGGRQQLAGRRADKGPV